MFRAFMVFTLRGVIYPHKRGGWLGLLHYTTARGFYKGFCKENGKMTEDNGTAPPKELDTPEKVERMAAWLESRGFKEGGSDREERKDSQGQS
jgi:hypothetical protein